MVCRFLLAVFVFLSYAQAQEKQDPCYQTHLNQGRIDCVELAGTFIFGNGTTCDHRLYKDVTVLRGRILFDDSMDEDPMSCFPKLTLIISPPEALYSNYPVIDIADSVMFMQSFEINPNLNIYGVNETWIRISARNYRMNRKTYMFLASRFGSARLDIPNHEEEGECNYEGNTKVVFMNELDNCTHLLGTLSVESPKDLQHDASVKTIDGCVSFQKTKVELEHIYFLKNVREIGCASNMAPFVDNPKLCVPYDFLELLADKYTYFKKDRNERDILVKNMKANLNNNNIQGCDTTCTAYDLEKTFAGKRCLTIYGDIRLRKSILPLVKDMHTLRGRLLVEGFDMANPFDALPKLTLIKTISQKPVVKIQYNHYLSKLKVPNITIESPSKVYLMIHHNYGYKMTHDYYKELYDRYDKKVYAEILHDYECFFPEPIKKLSELDNCTRIHGDLIINSYVTGYTETKLLRVTGCIRINGTSFDSFPFLDMIDAKSGKYCSGGHVLTFNRNLCPRFLFKRLRMAGPREWRHLHVVHGNKKDCFNVCTRDDLFATTKCNSIVEGVRMSEKVRKRLMLSLAGTDEVRGTIRVFKTKVDRIDEFVSLKKIVMDRKGPAIDIQENSELEFVDLRRLKEIESNDNTTKLIVIKGNGKYKMPYMQYKKLVDSFGEDRLDIDHRPNTNWYVGIIMGSGVVLLMCCIAGVVTFSIVLRKSKLELDEQERLLKKPPPEKLAGVFGNNPRSRMEILDQNGQPINEMEMQDGEMEMQMQKNRGGTQYMPLREQLENDGLGGDNGPVTARTAFIGAAPNAKYGGVMGENGAEYVCMPKTAATAYGGNLDPLKNNASVMNKGPVTAKTGMMYYGQLRNNASMATEAHGPKTAATAMLGGNNFYGNLRNNKANAPGDSTEDNNGPRTANTAMLGGKDFYGNLRKTPSSLTRVNSDETHGPRTANTAMLGGNNFYGNLRNNHRGNASKDSTDETVGPRTANTAMLGGKDFHGNLRKNKSSVPKVTSDEDHGPRTANTAMLGGKDFHGNLRKNKSSVPKVASDEDHGPRTANTAMLGANVFHGNLRKNKSSVPKKEESKEKNPPSAPKKSEEESKGQQESSNASVEKDAVTATTAKNNGKDFKNEVRKERSKKSKDAK